MIRPRCWKRLVVLTRLVRVRLLRGPRIASAGLGRFNIYGWGSVSTSLMRQGGVSDRADEDGCCGLVRFLWKGYIRLLRLNAAYVGLCKFVTVFKPQQTQSSINEHTTQNWRLPSPTQLCKIKLQINYGGRGWGIKEEKILGKPV